MPYRLHISHTEIARHAKALLQPIKYGENSVVLCYPGCFIGYTLHAFRTSPTILKKYLGPFYRKYRIIPVESAPGDTFDDITRKAAAYIHEIDAPPHTAALHKLVAAIVKDGYEPYFFLINMHVLSAETRDRVVQEFHDIITATPRSGLVYCTEANIFNEDHIRLFNTYHRLQQSMSVIPAFSDTEAYAFVETLGNSWGMDMSTSTIKKVVTICGGYLWLLREAVRAIRDGVPTEPSEIIRRSRIGQRAEYIVSLLDKRTIDAMYALRNNPHTPVPSDVTAYIESTNLMSKSGNTYKPTCSLFWDHIQHIKKRKGLTAINQKIFYGDADISKEFSPSEQRALLLLIAYRMTIVSRDALAQRLWGTDNEADGYSDWALDKNISRIRQKLLAIGLDTHVIVTKKRRGFLLT